MNTGYNTGELAPGAGFPALIRGGQYEGCQHGSFSAGRFTFSGFTEQWCLSGFTLEGHALKVLVFAKQRDADVCSGGRVPLPLPEGGS